MIFCCTVDQEDFFSNLTKNSQIFGFLFDLMVEGRPPRSFMILLLTFMGRDSSFNPSR